ncbi:MAG TPA: Ig-like domain-containing protein [Kofleriaceae bacterium]|nr:Ig-like domain-containing protein [Kofleriaceae bacterium]
MGRTLRVVATVCLLGIGIGCDQVGHDDRSSDVDEGGSGTFEVIAMSPEPDSSAATPLSSITLTFNDTVDLASAIDATVWIRHRESRRRVPAVISAGASDDQLVLTPVLPLASANRYTVDVDGVANPDGLTAVYEARFLVKMHLREDYERNDDRGLETYYESTWDELNGVRAVHWVGAGGDHTGGTGDDFQRDLTEYYYDHLQDPVYMLSRSSAGDDGDYLTGDDVLRVERVYAWDGVGLQRLHQSEPGADGAFDTGDELDRGATQRYYEPYTDASGRV